MPPTQNSWARWKSQGPSGSPRTHLQWCNAGRFDWPGSEWWNDLKHDFLGVLVKKKKKKRKTAWWFWIQWQQFQIVALTCHPMPQRKRPFQGMDLCLSSLGSRFPLRCLDKKVAVLPPVFLGVCWSPAFCWCSFNRCLLFVVAWVSVVCCLSVCHSNPDHYEKYNVQLRESRSYARGIGRPRGSCRLGEPGAAKDVEVLFAWMFVIMCWTFQMFWLQFGHFEHFFKDLDAQWDSHFCCSHIKVTQKVVACSAVRF